MWQKVAIGCAAVLAVLFVAIAGFFVWLGVGLESGDVPDTKVLESVEITENILQKIHQIAQLEEGETVEYYYSAGFLDHLDDMNIVTDRRLISYVGGDTPKVGIVRVDEMVSVTVDVQGGLLADTVLSVTDRQGDEIYLLPGQVFEF